MESQSYAGLPSWSHQMASARTSRRESSGSSRTNLFNSLQRSVSRTFSPTTHPPVTCRSFLMTLLLTLTIAIPDREYRGLMEDFVDWCHRNCLQINAGKTKELVDFHRRRHSPSILVNIQGRGIESVTHVSTWVLT